MRSLRRKELRKGYTLFELIVIVVVVMILGSVLVGTITSEYSNTRQTTAADLIRARIVEARAKAMEQGVTYRLAVHTDKTRIRLAPDTDDFESLSPGKNDGPDAKSIEDKLDQATAELQLNEGDTRTQNSGEWLTIATIGPDGTAKEDNTTVVVKEKNFQPIQVRIHGVIGSTMVVAAPK